jgi:hypothetical protein
VKQERIKNSDDVIRAVTSQTIRGGRSDFNSKYENVVKEIEDFESPKKRYAIKNVLAKQSGLTAYNPNEVK